MNPQHVRRLHAIADVAYQVKFVCDLMDIYLDGKIAQDTGLMEAVKHELKDAGEDFKKALAELKKQKHSYYKDQVIHEVGVLISGIENWNHEKWSHRNNST